MKTDEPLPTRVSLLERLRDAGDEASWAEFHRSYHGLLVGVARRAGLNEHEADEAVQETLIAIAKKMPEFHYAPGKDSFKGWLLQIARWKIVDQIRRRPQPRSASQAREPATVAERLARQTDPQHEDSAGGQHLLDPRDEFESIWDAEWGCHLLKQALGRVKRQAKPEHYAIYHLSVVEEQPIVEVCRTLGISAAAVYLAKYRVGALVKKELLRLRKVEL
jgi:RNA polymerase sigma-70 factor (ECF subfamily)